MKQKISLVWFKRDLRISDHAPLIAAQKLGLPVLPLYVCEPEYWQLPSSSCRHWRFIHDYLEDLRSDLESLGQSLIARTGDSSLDFSLRVYIANIREMLMVETELRMSIFESFKEKNVEIPFPQWDVNFKRRKP